MSPRSADRGGPIAFSARIRPQITMGGYDDPETDSVRVCYGEGGLYSWPEVRFREMYLLLLCSGAARGGDVRPRGEEGVRSLTRDRPAFLRSTRPAGVPPVPQGVLQGPAGGPQRSDLADSGAGRPRTVWRGASEDAEAGMTLLCMRGELVKYPRNCLK